MSSRSGRHVARSGGDRQDSAVLEGDRGFEVPATVAAMKETECRSADTPAERSVDVPQLIWCAIAGFMTIQGAAGLIISPWTLAAQSGRGFRCSMFAGLGAGGLVLSLVALTLGVGLGYFKGIRRTNPPGCYGLLSIILSSVGCVIVSVLLLGTIVGGGTVIRMSRQNPSFTDDLTGAGDALSAPVKIVRDQHGIAHIQADTRSDAYFAQGFVTTQDRLAQMETLRLAGRGELASVVGSDAAVRSDKTVRAAGFHLAGAQLCDGVRKENRGLLQSYVNGVNFFLQKESRRAPEFLFYGRWLSMHEPDRWSVGDVCRIFRLLQWRISRNVGEELKRLKMWLETSMTYEEIEAAFPHRFLNYSIVSPESLGIGPSDAEDAAKRDAEDRALEKNLYETVMAGYRRSAPASHASPSTRGRRADSAKHRVPNDGLKKTPNIKSYGIPEIIGISEGGGSNAWATRSAGGHTILASDPHLTIDLPSPWHPVHMQWGSREQFGVTMAGTPSIYIGKSGGVAVGITISKTDLGDLFVMVPDPERPKTHYMHNGKSKAFSIRREVIKVRSGADVVLDVRESLYGPDIASAWDVSEEHAVCVWSAALLPDSDSVDAVLDATDGSRTTVKEYRDALSPLKAPGMSMATADEEGGIGYILTGQHPRRARGHTGRFPILGNGSFDHLGMIPYAELPTRVDTEVEKDGWVGCANQRIYPVGYKYFLGYDWSAEERSRLVHETLQGMSSSELSSAAAMRRMQLNDTSGIWVFDFRDGMFNPDSGSHAAAVFDKYLSSAGRTARDALRRDWNGEAVVGSRHPTLLWRWLSRVNRRVSEEARRVSDGYHQILRETQGIILDPSPAALKLCAGALRSAAPAKLAESCVALAAEEFGVEASADLPEWGSAEANQLTANHLLLHGTLFQCLGDRTAAKSGDRSSINVADAQAKTDGPTLPVSFAASSRHVIDLKDKTRYWLSLPGGTSGNMWSKHYDDLLGKLEAHVEVPLRSIAGETMALHP